MLFSGKIFWGKMRQLVNASMWEWEEMLDFECGENTVIG